MIQVVIADDEVRICQLIQALVNWEELGMEVAGVAHNGLEAIRLVNTCRPDILITDIRMPGCSGLELVEKVKADMPELEIIVISGYAHFEYAQQAIRYGVGDYLLKPVSRAELNATLEKLKARVCERREQMCDREELERKTEMDVRLLQNSLVGALSEQPEPAVSMQSLRETYRLKVLPGSFQAFRMKMDCGKEGISQSSAAILMEKAREALLLGPGGKCIELVVCVKGFWCEGFLNYEPERQEDIRRAFRSCVNQLGLQKSLFRPVSFSAALGRASSSPEELGASMREASALIQERLVRGTGRVFERQGGPSALGASGVLEHYIREITRAAETLSVDLTAQAVDALAGEVCAVKDVRGSEILETVYSAAELFAVKTQMPDRAGYLEALRGQCENCGSAQEVFACLRDVETGYMDRLAKQQENDTARPIRKAKQYIQEHYSEPVTQEEVSSAVGLSPAYFSVLFKKTEGEGFARYLMNVRMEQAKILLRESNLPVAEICRRVGYNDLKHFTHTFEKAAGVKPAVYRKLYG